MRSHLVELSIDMLYKDEIEIQLRTVARSGKVLRLSNQGIRGEGYIEYLHLDAKSNGTAHTLPFHIVIVIRSKYYS